MDTETRNRRTLVRWTVTAGVTLCAAVAAIILGFTSGAFNFDPIALPTEDPAATPPPPAHIISAAAGEGGSISPERNVSVVSGGEYTFSIEVAPGYEILYINVDGQQLPAADSHTFTDVQSNHTINVVFRQVGG